MKGIQKLPLASEEPARLELRWNGSTAAVFLDGVHRADLSGPDDMKRGWSTDLDDGSKLEVRSVTRVLFPELSVLRNGQHVASSPSHPARMLSVSSGTLMAVGVFLLVAGVLEVMGKNWLSAVFGLLYVTGGFLIRKRFFLGVVVATIPVFASVVLLVFSAVTSGVNGRWFIDVALTCLFIVFLIRSVLALQDTRSLEPRAAA